MGDAKDATLAKLLASMDTSPKTVSLSISVVCPSGQINGSWIAATSIAGVRAIGTPGDTPIGAVRNLLSKLSGAGGMWSDPEAALAMELALATPETQKAIGKAADPEYHAAYDKALEELEEL